MNEKQILDALKKGPGGVQVNITEKGYTVSTTYRPAKRCHGGTIREAAFGVAVALWSDRRCPAAVRAALGELEL